MWTVYILQCADETLYTGITNDLEKRLRKHDEGSGAKYTKGRGPHTLLWSERHPNRGSASKREAEIKALKKPEKLALVISSKNGEA